MIDTAGKLLKRWPLGFSPYAIHACEDGTVHIGGIGLVAKVSKEGKVLKVVDRRKNEVLGGKASGITATEKDVFVAFGTGGSLRSRSVLVRLDRNLENAKPLASGLRGCRQRLDLAAHDGLLYVAENALHHVVVFDREGKVKATWGRRAREGLVGFGSCCNPMNICFGDDGLLYTAESGLGRVKCYTPAGTFKALVGYVGVERFNRPGRLAASCSNIVLAVAPGARQIFVQDFKNNLIRVLEKQ